MDAELRLAMRNQDMASFLVNLHRSGAELVDLTPPRNRYDQLTGMYSEEFTKHSDLIESLGQSSNRVGNVVEYQAELMLVCCSQERSGRIISPDGEVFICTREYRKMVVRDGRPLVLEIPENWRRLAMLKRYNRMLNRPQRMWGVSRENIMKKIEELS